MSGHEPDRRGKVDAAFHWTLHNLDGVIGVAVAGVIGLLDLVGGYFSNQVTQSATLIVLAAMLIGMLAERSRRASDMKEATDDSRKALEDIAMVRALHGDEVTRALQQAREGTERWTFKGGTGTYLRAVTLPECVAEARRQRRSLTMWVDIVNPDDERACATYARFRQSFHVPEGARQDDLWTTGRTRKEGYATVLAVCWYRQRLKTLDISVYLSSTVPALRFDLSSSCLVITQEDPKRVSLLVDRARPLYDYYDAELRLVRDQARELNLRDAVPLSDEPDVEEARRLFDALALPLPAEFSDADVGEIVEKALHPRTPYQS